MRTHKGFAVSVRSECHGISAVVVGEDVGDRSPGALFLGWDRRVMNKAIRIPTNYRRPYRFLFSCPLRDTVVERWPNTNGQKKPNILDIQVMAQYTARLGIAQAEDRFFFARH